ncbi:MAG TPA: GNAT family N-acetyltransferase [Gemmatimonadaceae bacterium]|nr:GNAT family N-acetyltransferase [Gemmatimonadaceae bacterium]
MPRTFLQSQPTLADAVVQAPGAADTQVAGRDPAASCRAAILRGPSEERMRCERDLDRLGVPVPLEYRQLAAPVVRARETWLVAVRGREGRCAGALGVNVRPALYVPGHVVLDVVRLGAALAPALRRLALETLIGAVRRDPRVLRLTVQIFSRDADDREDYATHLTSLGLKPLEVRNGYQQTLVLDLRLDERTIFEGFERSGRRNIKAAAKCPATIAPITDPRYAARLETLMIETLTRTGGRYAAQDWRAMIDLTREAPHLSRLVGVFRNDAEGPESLLAFAWGCAHGDHVEYSQGGSTREVPFRMPMAYPLMWDLITWAKRIGATWFDFGGVSDAADTEGADPLRGISAFKRYFSHEVVTVADEWVYEPSSVRARAARIAHRWLSR